MSIEEKIKKLLEGSEEEIKDASDDEDTEVKTEENASKKDALVAKIKKALNSGSLKTQTINGVKNLSKADLELALDILNGEHVGYASKELKNLLGDLIEETEDDDYEDDEDKKLGTDEDEDDEIEIKDIKEDIDALVNGENFSEEFKAKATTIFESAVLVRVKKEVSRITEELEEKNENALREQKEQLIDLIDGYLGTISEQWLSDNEIALESSLKTEMYDNFITKMKTVFVESYIEVPEEKFDILEDKENQIKQISEQLNKATSTLIDSRKVINQLEREKVVSEATSKMSSTDKERLIELTENLEFDVTNMEDFISKVETIKESYFGNGVKKPQTSQKFISDTKVLTEDKKSTTVHPDVAMYL